MTQKKVIDNSIKKPHLTKVEHQSFYSSIGPVLVCGQFFGMLPGENLKDWKCSRLEVFSNPFLADGVMAKDERDVTFRWNSFRTIYSLIFLFCGTVESCLGTRRLLRLGFNINFAEGLLFFISAMVRAYLLFGLARRWKEISVMWRKCEEAFLKHPYRVRGWSLAKRIRVTFVVLGLFSISD